jgi:uncharacterized membrane-anchored protein YitT (DUF2179 family)
VKKFKINPKIRRYVELVIGMFLYSLAYTLFLKPSDIVAGDVDGIALIFQHSIDPNLMITILCAFLLLISFPLLGIKTTVYSILGTILFPLFVTLTSNICDVFEIDYSNLLLIAIVAGVVRGVGYGLSFKNGFTTGGTDILNQIVSKYFHVSIGTAMIIVDGSIVVAGGFVYGWTSMLYALIVLYILSIITDRIMLGISTSKAFYIITEEEEKVKEYILKELGHGVTVFPVKGGYTKEKQQMLMCVIPTREYYVLKEGISEIDKEAFFVITDAYEVKGGA